jgi:hypothetical protein
LLSLVLCACQTDTIEVTRLVIKERRVIEKVIVTVEVTRIQRVVETPEPTPDAFGPGNPEPSPSPTPTPTSAPRPAPAATAPPRSNANTILAALKNMEQTLIPLVQALNSDPLPGAYIIQLYDTIRSAPTFDVSGDEPAIQSVYTRYREQVDYVLGQGADLYNHLVKIESGEADQTQVSPTHLGLARDAASTGTSTVQGLIRELENYSSP